MILNVQPTAYHKRDTFYTLTGVPSVDKTDNYAESTSTTPSKKKRNAVTGKSTAKVTTPTSCTQIKRKSASTVVRLLNEGFKASVSKSCLVLKFRISRFFLTLIFLQFVLIFLNALIGFALKKKKNTVFLRFLLEFRDFK